MFDFIVSGFITARKQLLPFSPVTLWPLNYQLGLSKRKSSVEDAWHLKAPMFETDTAVQEWKMHF